MKFVCLLWFSVIFVSTALRINYFETCNLSTSGKSIDQKFGCSVKSPGMKDSSVDIYVTLKRPVYPMIDWTASMSEYGKNVYTPFMSITNVSICNVQKSPGFAYMITFTGKSLSKYLHDCPYNVSLFSLIRSLINYLIYFLTGSFQHLKPPNAKSSTC